jgi:phosphoenolpyruvate carboxylase
VLRDQEGEAVFDVVETIRQTAVRFRREADPEAGEELTTLLKKLTREQTISVVRAFSYFSHLANIAEDQHHMRRRRAHLLAGSKPQPSSVAYRADALKEPASTANSRDLPARSLIAPVLTAHPTEVQRKSILDAEHDIARLLAERDLPLTPKEQRAHNLQLLQARIATLWQTRMLRYEKLTVADEIENALSYYRITFLRELPACTTTSRRARSPLRRPAPPTLRADGQLDRRRPRRQPERQRRHHAARAGAPRHHHLRLLPRRSARAGRRAVDLDPAGAGRRRAASAGRRPRPTPRRTAATSPTGAP